MVYEKWYSWPLGIVAVIIYGYSCFQIKIFGEMLLQILYIIIAIYGWLSWNKNDSNIPSISISKISSKEYFLYIGLSTLLCLLSYFILKKLNGDVILLDALSNGFAITATIMTVRKKLENWLLWIPVNLLTIYIMYLKEMPFYMLLYFVYAAFAALGYYQWLHTFKKQKSETYEH